MNDEWEVVPFAEIAQRRATGWTPGQSTEIYVGLEHVAPYELRLIGIGSSDDVASNKTRFIAGDVLFGKLRPYFRKVVRPSFSGVCSTDMWAIHPIDEARVDPAFLHWIIANPAFSDFANSAETGTRMPRASWAWVGTYEVSLPPLDEQRRIAEVLRALDDRIDSAARLEQRLGEAVIAEYRVAVEEREGDGQLSLVEAVDLVNGGAYTAGASGTGRIVIRIKELNSGPSETTVYNSITVPATKTAYPGDVLFAWSGSLGVWRWYRDEAIVNQHIFKIIGKKHPVWLGWVHVLDELERFQDIAAGKATTMGHITKDHLERTKVPTFSEQELAALTNRVEPLWTAQLKAGRGLHTLQSVRDQLLPALLSGEIRVSLAEEKVEALS
jgi:type I restriction enzyme S subunit